MPSITEILETAKVCKYLAATDEANGNALQGGSVQGSLSKLLFTVVQDSEWALVNGAAGLDEAGNYIFWLCGSYYQKARDIITKGFAPTIVGIAPSITIQPVGGQINAGSNLTLSVSASGSPVLIYNWQLYTSNTWQDIQGANSATFIKNNVTDADAGLYRVVVTNNYGNAVSIPATITIAVPLVVSYWYGSTDPYPTLFSGTDGLTYQVQQAITHNQPISLVLPVAGQTNMYGVLKIPIGELTKTGWYNTPNIGGQIEDQIWRLKLTIGQFDYYITRQAYTYVATSPVIFG